MGGGVDGRGEESTDGSSGEPGGDTDPGVPLAGSTLVTGPSNVGKTRLTAGALASWLERHGPDGVVVFDFAPIVERDGRVLGGRLTRFFDVPDDVWYGILDAHAPRADSDDAAGALTLARENAEGAAAILAAAPPDPSAVFANDATIPFQHGAGDLEGFLAYCDRADCAVLNAFDSDELGTDDPVSRRERTSLARLRGWADRTVELS